jgi:hypothetical protein
MVYGVESAHDMVTCQYRLGTCITLTAHSIPVPLEVVIAAEDELLARKTLLALFAQHRLAHLTPQTGRVPVPVQALEQVAVFYGLVATGARLVLHVLMLLLLMLELACAVARWASLWRLLLVHQHTLLVVLMLMCGGHLILLDVVVDLCERHLLRRWLWWLLLGRWLLLLLWRWWWWLSTYHARWIRPVAVHVHVWIVWRLRGRWQWLLLELRRLIRVVKTGGRGRGAKSEWIG